eukprot:CAMPEP_0181185344 /NCGR_PEP_ID=MMETSP1096-20121128/9455_1 /TAXON_ID=156174 ORGANISM="Chrysochromulina ericina, Strain CCMP281" /NCGR_SAMPLE_ID=MMETSP1096 /ASSEMBLY_ACC=CAM_ASM_000453 /LENGTH=38 /DNA_ID= /DNA_START= /DNA_END= /DNA_ORIENTATION=
MGGVRLLYELLLLRGVPRAAAGGVRTEPTPVAAGREEA